MKIAILAGGVGSRLSEETESRPKPMVEIGGKPILWHIMQHYAHYFEPEFYIALGYKGEYIKKYIVDHCNLTSDLYVNFRSKEVLAWNRSSVEVDWQAYLIDTGQHTQTGGRVKRLGRYLAGSTFMMTYGDGVSDLDLRHLLAFHRAHGKLATITAVRPPARFGHLVFEGDRVVEFLEKPQAAEGWINGAFFVLEPEVFDYIEGDETHWEHEPLQRLARDRQLVAYRHDSFWQCMDTLRDKRLLESLWEKGVTPWVMGRRA